MKKTVVFSLLFIIVATVAFADLTDGLYICAWGRGAFVPLWYESALQTYGKDPIADIDKKDAFKNGIGVTWDPLSQPRVDFRIMGFSEHVGFVVHVNSELALNYPGNGDNGAQLWVKPFGNDWLKMTVANQMVDDSLRGKVATDTGFENFILGGTMLSLKNKDMEPLNQDVIFNRFAGGRGSKDRANASNTSTHINSALYNVFFLNSSPIDGLFLGLMLQGDYPKTELEESWRQVQFGAGYQIADIGHVRAQFIGGYHGKYEYDPEKSVDPLQPSKIEAAFAFTMVENLVVDLGLKYWFPVTTISAAKSERINFRGIDIGLGANYGISDFNITFMGQVKSLGGYGGYSMDLAHVDGNDKSADSLTLAFNLIPSYDFSFGTLGLSMMLYTKTAAKDTEGNEMKDSVFTQWGAGAFYKKGFGKGYIKTGVTYTSAPIETRVLPDNKTETGANGRYQITIPIIFEYAFF